MQRYQLAYLMPICGDCRRLLGPGGERSYFAHSISHLTLQSERVVWDGAKSGHGRLGRRNLQIRAWGKAVRGTERVLEVEDDGENAMRVVAGMVAPSAGRAAG